MTKKLYWGVSILIIGFIALQVYLYIDKKNFMDGFDDADETAKTEPPTTPEVAINDPKTENDPIQPIEPPEVDIPQVPEENSQQNSSVKTVSVKNYLEGLEDIDVFDSITIPTDDEISSYTLTEVIDYIGVMHKAKRKSKETTAEFTKQLKALNEAINEAISNDKISAEEYGQLLDQKIKHTALREDFLEQQDLLFQESERASDQLGRF